jgi:hypothetical protein
MGQTLGVSTWFSLVFIYEAVNSLWEEQGRLERCWRTSKVRLAQATSSQVAISVATIRWTWEVKTRLFRQLHPKVARRKLVQVPTKYSVDSREIGKVCIGMYLEHDIKIVFLNILLENWDICKNCLSEEPMCWPGFKLCLSWTPAYRVPATLVRCVLECIWNTTSK